MAGLVVDCQHCGLPAPPESKYCCYGCELVAGLIEQSNSAASGLRGKAFVCAFFFMNLMAVSFVLWAEDLYGAVPEGGMAAMATLFRWVSALLASPVVAILGVPLARRGLSRLRSGYASAEFLVTIGAGSAFLVSWYRVLTGSGPLYFDAAAATLVLYTAGRAIEATARTRALSGLLDGRSRRTTGYERYDGSCWTPVTIPEMDRGDHVRIPEGSEVPADGEIIGEGGWVNAAAATGESKPIAAQTGSEVIAGAVAIGGSIELRIARSPGESFRANTEALARRALTEKTTAERVADRAAAFLTPTVATIAVLTVAFWLSQGLTERALTAGIAVLVVACPCSFGIAVPLALRASMARAAEAGVVIARAEVIERLAEVRSLVVDKTGTLTTSELAAVSCSTDAGHDAAHVLASVAALEKHTSHPLARALVEGAQRQNLVIPEAQNVEVRPQLGVTGSIGGACWAVGNSRLMRALGVPVSGGKRAPADLLVACDGKEVAQLTLTSSMKTSTRSVFDALRSHGYEIEIASGDDAAVVDAVGEAYGIAAQGGLTPRDKLERIQSMKAPVAMIGDGTNDAPALAAAAVGIALGHTSDLARGLADIRIADGELERLPWSLTLARRTRAVIRTNLSWAILYNLACVAWATTGTLPPAAAAAAMLGSSLIVVTNAARLLHSPLPSLAAASPRSQFVAETITGVA